MIKLIAQKLPYLDFFTYTLPEATIVQVQATEIEGFFVTKEELEQFVPKAEVEQLQREAFEFAVNRLVFGHASCKVNDGCAVCTPVWNDYLSSKSKEGKDDEKAE